MTASVYADRPPSELLCSITVAGHYRCGAPAPAPPATDPARIPPAPWCGVLLSAAIEDDADALTWLGDFARYLAWTYLLEES